MTHDDDQTRYWDAAQIDIARMTWALHVTDNQLAYAELEPRGVLPVVTPLITTAEPARSGSPKAEPQQGPQVPPKA